MADIELVIKVSEDIVQGIIDGENDTPRNIVRAFQATVADAIKNGIPLPKGHGRLIDADALPLNKIDDANYGSNYIRIAPTIIEADTVESEGSDDRT